MPDYIDVDNKRYSNLAEYFDRIARALERIAESLNNKGDL